MKLKGKYSRRKAIRRMTTAGAAAALGAASSPQNVQALALKATAFAFVGDRWHNFDYIRSALTKTLVEGIGLSIDFTAERTHLSDETLNGYRLLIMLCDGMTFPNGYTTPHVMYDPQKDKLVSDPPYRKIDETHEMWMTQEQGRVIKEFVLKGGGALFFHNSSYISRDNQDFRDVEGAYFTGHTPLRPFKLKITNSNHPITSGVNDFVITEEQHFLIYDKDPKDVFMISVNEEGLTFKDQGSTCEAGWAYDYGKGRVCFMTPGHMIPSFWNPEYEKLQQNSIKWLLREI